MSECYSFGEWVRRRRKALDLTQDALALRVGCSKVLISKIETDARRPSRAIATLLATALALDLDEQAAFVQAARAELAVARLPTPTQGIPLPTLLLPSTTPVSDASPPALLPTPPLPSPAPASDANPAPALPITEPPSPHRDPPPPEPSDLVGVPPAITAPALAPTLSRWMWSFWAWWSGAGALGWGLGQVLGWYGGSLVTHERVLDLGDGTWLFGAGLAETADTIIIGATVTLVQMSVLRRHSDQGDWRRWGLVTMLAWILTGTLSRFSLSEIGGLMLGLTLGIAQWLALHRLAHRKWWVLVSSLAWAPIWSLSASLNTGLYQAIGGTMTGSTYERGPGWMLALLLAGALVGGLWGVITGGVLARILAPARG